jgi:hypothetical protein
VRTQNFKRQISAGARRVVNFRVFGVVSFLVPFWTSKKERYRQTCAAGSKVKVTTPQGNIRTGKP